MRKIHFVLIPFIWILCALVGASGSWGARYASIIIEPMTGRVLKGVNTTLSIPPASLTKIMTLYLTFQALASGKLALDQKLSASARASRQQPSKLGLQQGDQISVSDAIQALIVKSANDVSVILAEALGGTEKNFARQMTAMARKLGMRHTVFCNASGLPHSGQRTTARDMAILSAATMRFRQFYPYFRSKTFKFRGTIYHNHNKLLGKVLGVEGLKTGYTDRSGYNLATSIVRNHRRLIVVVLGGSTGYWRDQHIARLIDAAYNKPSQLYALTAQLGLPETLQRIYIPKGSVFYPPSVTSLVAAWSRSQSMVAKKRPQEIGLHSIDSLLASSLGSPHSKNKKSAALVPSVEFLIQQYTLQNPNKARTKKHL